MNLPVSSIASPAGSSSKPDQTEPVVCFTNIGPREQRRRMVMGLVTLAVGIGFAALLILINANVGWRLLLFFPFAAAGTGYFQARDKT